MTQPLLPFVPGRIRNAVDNASSVEELESVVTDFLAEIGFHSSAYHLVRMTGVGDFLHTFFTDYPAEWINHYEQSNYIHHDPVHALARKATAPVVWDRIDFSAAGPTSSLVFNEASEFKIGSGISVPVRGPTSFALFSAVPDGSARDRKELIELYEPLLLWLGYHAHERAFELFQPNVEEETDSQINLTPREQECLRWIAAGKSAPMIGDILTISEHTVARHVAAAQLKLNAQTRAHAAVKAVTLGLIDID